MVKSRVTVDGKPGEIMREEGRLWERAVTSGVRDVGTGIKKLWRGQIRSAGLGNRLARTVRSEVFPKNTVSASAAGVVFTKADDIIAGHDEGSLIRSQEGFWLAIPLPAAGTLRRGKKPDPLEWERAHSTPLRFVFRPGNSALLVAEAGVSSRGVAKRRKRVRLKSGKFAKNVQTVPIFVLVPQVKLPQRLDLLPAAEREGNRLDNLIVAHYERIA